MMATEDRPQQTSKVGDESAMVVDNKTGWMTCSSKMVLRTSGSYLRKRSHTQNRKRKFNKDHTIKTLCSTFLDNGHYLQPNSVQTTDNTGRTFSHHENKSVSQNIRAIYITHDNLKQLLSQIKWTACANHWQSYFILSTKNTLI